MDDITTVALTKYYGKSRGITDLNLTVSQGDFFGFIGPNGAGKSTTIRILLGLITPTSGTAQLFGCPAGSKELLARVGYMPSEAIFYGDMRVGEVIAYSASLRGRSCTKNSSLLCDRLQLDKTKKISELSLGNRKKVSIVCAMQHEPELYILDEPTSGLDPLMQKEFFDLLHERNNDGATVFLSSHVLNEIQHNCKNAAVIRDGSIITCDSVANLASSGARRVTVRGITAVPKGLEVKSVTAADNSVSFLYHGEMRQLLQVLATLPVEDLTVTEPDLEEIFLHFYTGRSV